MTSKAIFTRYDLNVEEDTFRNCQREQSASSYSHDLSISHENSNKSSLSSFGQRQSFLTNAKFQNFYVQELSRAVQYSARDKLHKQKQDYQLKRRNALIKLVDILLFKFYTFMSKPTNQANLITVLSLLLILLSECLSNITSEKVLNNQQYMDTFKINIHLSLFISIVLLVIRTIEEIICTVSPKKLILYLLLMGNS
jgi:hypothetical protein